MNSVGNSASDSPPVVEVETSGAVLYEQQNIVYTVRVVSSNNLKTLNPVIPHIDGAIDGIEELRDKPEGISFREWTPIKNLRAIGDVMIQGLPDLGWRGEWVEDAAENIPCAWTD